MGRSDQPVGVRVGLYGGHFQRIKHFDPDRIVEHRNRDRDPDIAGYSAHHQFCGRSRQHRCGGVDQRRIFDRNFHFPILLCESSAFWNGIGNSRVQFSAGRYGIPDGWSDQLAAGDHSNGKAKKKSSSNFHLNNNN